MKPPDWAAAGLILLSAVVMIVGIAGLVSGSDESAGVAVSDPPDVTVSEPDETQPEPEGDPAEELPAETASPEPTAAPVPEPEATPPPEPEPEPQPAAETEPTPPAAETVDEFIAAFDTALKSGDLDFVYDRLHPVTTDAFGTDVCRAFVDSQFSLASALVMAGAAVGPDDVDKFIAGKNYTVPDRFTAEVTLTFQGQDFPLTGEYALVDGEMRWLSDCA